MAEQKKKTTRLKEIFYEKKTELMPLGALPIHAQMAEKAGYRCFQISGAFVAWWLYGVPDVGLVTRTEVIDNARRIAESVDIPVYCDADTGYGGIQNVRKTVHDFIRAGIAGVHIEDQIEPKKGGGYAGIEIVSDEEAIGRLRCASAARDELDPDFVLTARTDAYAVARGGIEEALRRGRLYLKETNVDVIFYEGIRTWEEISYLLKNTPGPAYCIPSRHAGKTPSVAELSQMGQRVHLLQFVLPGVQDVWKLLLKLKNSGEVAVLDDYIQSCFNLEGTEEFVGFGDTFMKPTMEQVRAIEERYLPAEKQRDYENSLHD